MARTYSIHRPPVLHDEEVSGRCSKKPFYHRGPFDGDKLWNRRNLVDIKILRECQGREIKNGVPRGIRTVKSLRQLR
jgi:hypothetical protein